MDLAFTTRSSLPGFPHIANSTSIPPEKLGKSNRRVLGVKPANVFIYLFDGSLGLPIGLYFIDEAVVEEEDGGHLKR